MAYAHAPTAVLPRKLATPKIKQAPQRNFFVRLLEAIERANMRRAEHEIARYLRVSGGKLTDDLEREIERRFLTR